MLQKRLLEKEKYLNLPKKRIESFALILRFNEVLIVQKTNSRNWSLPGGIVEFEESPREGLIRELGEQLNHFPRDPRLLLTNYISNKDFRGEFLQFVFLIGNLNWQELSAFKFNPRNIKDYQFIKRHELSEYLEAQTANFLSILSSDFASRSSIYLENGRAFN